MGSFFCVFLVTAAKISSLYCSRASWGNDSINEKICFIFSSVVSPVRARFALGSSLGSSLLLLLDEENSVALDVALDVALLVEFMLNFFLAASRLKNGCECLALFFPSFCCSHLSAWSKYTLASSRYALRFVMSLVWLAIFTQHSVNAT